ncbi:MGDG synthase family glycosyltransferase [Clostridium paridis]|uniref:UDP-N-acetylglucosamine--LPS N-acetylglucosamine transferase n=1 Tax=Clostridium paridis TaxID=2803863 RepID=A0A937FGS0_9CLOT|nr:glycosyltransferase [Clostridium paridis]MBL4932695.1 UDP-N-acetylglucosamine--LPS N-acetylglucosamine transferase [Clostridium paridis]
MKKVLILTASTGQGHNQAANSLKTVFEKKGWKVDKYDFLKKNSNFLNAAIVGGYEFAASKIPWIYGWFYHLTDKKITNKLLNIVFFNTQRKFLRYIENENPDIIIGTHPMSVNLVTTLKSQNKINIPFISIVTDFKVHYAYINKFTDAYITASDYTKDYLITRGIPGDIIFPYGIPINPIFFENDKEVSATKDDDYFNILLMGGSMGLENISHVLKKLITNKHLLRITVVCGNNDNLKMRLLSEYSAPIPNKKLHILGFTKDISAIMDYSDIIISKPGGLTVSESIAKKLPIIIPFAIPGQEYENVEFLTQVGCAKYVDHMDDINYIVDSLISNPSEIDTMKDNLDKLRNNYSINKIYDLSEKLSTENAIISNFSMENNNEHI